jgi:hypothetical protein
LYLQLLLLLLALADMLTILRLLIAELVQRGDGWNLREQCRQRGCPSLSVNLGGTSNGLTTALATPTTTSTASGGGGGLVGRNLRGL